MKKLFIAQSFCWFSMIFFSCQRELTGDINSPNPVDKTCSLTQVSNLNWSSLQEDSTMYTKITYDSMGRILHVITPKKDTSTYTYFSNHIDVNDPYTADDGSGGEVTYDFREKYSLQSTGLASNSVTTLLNGTYTVDSTGFSYDSQGKLTEERFFDFQNSDNATIDFAYSNGNLQKVSFNNATSYYPDSMTIKYSNDLIPAESFRIVYWDKYRKYDYYPWTGKASKNLRSEVDYYFSWGVDQITYSYDVNADNVPTAVRTVEVQSGFPAESATWFVTVSCK